MADEKIDLSGFAQGLSGGAEPLPFSPPADPNALLAPGLTPSQVGDAADANAAPAAGPRFLARSAGGPLSMHDAFEAVAYARSARDRAETPEKRAKAEAAIQTVVSRMAPLLLENEGAVAVGRLVNDETIPDVGEFSDGFGKRAPFEFTEDQNRNVRILLAEPFISDAGEYVIQSPDDDGDTVALEAIPEEKLGEVKKFLFGSNTGWTVGSQVFEEAGEAVAGQPVLDAVRKPGVVRSLARGVAPVATMLLNALPSEDRNQTVETPFGTFNYVPDITGDLDLDLARMQDPIYLKSLLAAGNGMRLTAWDQAARAGAGIVDFVAVNYLTGAALGGVGKAAGLAFRGVRTGAAATAEAAGVTRAFFGSRIRDIAKAQVMNGRTALRTSANADVRNVFEEMGYSVIQGFATGDYDIVGNALSGYAEGAFELGVGSVVRGGNKLLGKGLEGGAAALRDLSPINLGNTLAGRVARNVATTAERVRVGVRGAAGRVGVNEAARTAHEQARRGDFLANAWIKGVQKEGDDLARRGIEAARAAGNHVLSGRMASELWGTLSQGLVLGGTFGAYQSAQASAARNGERWEDLTAGQQWWRYATAFKDDPAIWGSVLAMGFLPAAYQTTMGRMPGSMQAEYRRTVRGLLERELGTMGQRWAAKSVETGFKDGAMYAHGVLSNADVSTFQAETAGSEPTVAEDPYLLLRSSGRAVDLVRHGMEREVLNALPGLHQEQLTKLARELDSLPTAERSLVRGVRQAVRGLIDQRAKVTDERAEVARHRARVAAENQADLNIRQRSQRKAAGARAAAKLATQPANVDLGSTAALPDVGVGVPRGQRVRALREAVKDANQEALAPYFIREGDDVWRVRRRMARIEREIDGDDARYFVMGSGSRLLAGPLAEGYSSLEAAMRAAVVYTDPIQPRPAWEMPRLLDLDAREAGAARMGRGEPFQPEDAPLFDRPEAPTTLQRPQAASRANEGPGDVFARTGKWPRTHKGQPTTWLARVIELGGFDARIERDGFRGEIMSTFDGGKGHAKGVYKGPNSRGKRGIGLESWVESLNSEQYQTSETYAEADERSLDPSDVLDWVASESAGMGVFPLPEYQAEYGDALRRIDEQDQLADLEAQVLEDGYSSIEEAEADRRQGSLEAPETTAEVLAELDYLLESDDNPFGETAESLQAKLEDPVYLEARRQAEAFLELDLPGIDREELARMARDPYQVKSALETLANAWARAGDILHVDQSLPIGDGSAEAVADASVEADAALSAGSSSLFGQSTVTREAGDALHETPGRVDRRGGESVRDSKWQAMALAARLALDGGSQADAVAVGMLLDVGLDGAWTPVIQGVSGLSRAEVEGVRERLLEAADLAADQAVDVVRRWGAEAGFEPFSQSQLDAKPKKGELSLRQLLGLLTLAPPVRQSDSRSGVKRNPSEMAADLRQWIERSTSDSLMNSIAMPPGEADLLVKRLEAGLGQMGKGEVRLNGLLARLNMRLRSLDKAQDAPAPNGQTRREVVQSLFETLTGGPLVVRVGNKANQGVKRRARVTREDEFDQLKAAGFDPVTVYAGTVLQVRHLIEDLGQYGVGQFGEDGTLADWAPFLDPYDAMDNIGRTRGVLRGIATGNPMLRDRFLESVDPEGNPRFENEAQGLKAWADLVQRARDAASGTRAALLYMARESNKGKKGSEYENVDAVLRAMGEASLQNEIPVELVPVLEKLGMVRQTDDGPRLDTNQAQQFIENFAQQEIARRDRDGETDQLDVILYSNPIGPALSGLLGVGRTLARTAFNEWANVTDPGFENGVGSRAVGALLNRKETAFSRNRRSDRIIRGVLRVITLGGRLSKKYADPDGRLSVGIPAWVARANRAFGESKIRSDALVQSLLAEWQAVQQEMDVSLTLDESVAIAQVVATDSLRRMFEPERWMRRFPGMTKLQAERLLDLTRKIVSLSDRLGEVQRRAGILSDEQFESQAGRWVARVRTRSGEESAKERGTEVQDYSRAQEAHADPWDTTMNRVMDMRALLPRRVFEATREVQVWNMLNSIRRNRNLWVTSAEYDQLPPYLKEQFTKSSMPGSLTKAEADRLSQSHIAEVNPETGEPIRDSNGNPQMRPLTKAELAAQEAEKQRLLRERKAASMDQVMLSLWARQQRDATETPEEKAEALEAIQNGEPRKGRKAPMTPAKQKILNLLEDGYITTQVYRDLALAVSLSERQVTVLEQAVQEWKRVQTILAPRFWIANVFSSVLTNHATQRLSMLDFVMSMSTGQGYYAEAARGIDRYIAGIEDGSITTDDDGNVRVDPNTADYANMEVIAKTVHYLGGGTWHRTMPGGIGGVDLVDLFGSAGSMSSRHHNQDQAQQLASAVSDIVGKQAALVGRLSAAWHHVTTGGTPQDRADAQMAVFAAHQQFELFFKLAATLAALRQQPVMSRAGVPVPLDVRVRRAVSLGAEGTVNYAARNDLVARFSQTIRLGLTVREKNAAREAGSNDLRTFRIAGEKGSLWAKQAQRFTAGFMMSRPFLAYQAGMLPTMAMAAANRPFGAVVGTWALLLGAQWWLGADEEQERRRNRDLAGQRGGHGITKVPPAELTPLQDPKVLANLRERFPGVPVNLHALADVTGMTQKSRMTIDEIASFLEEMGGGGPFNPNLGRYESVLRLGQEGFVDISNLLDAFSAPARFNGRFQELHKAFTESRWDLLFTNDTPFGTAPALGQGWLHAAFLAMNGRGDQSRTESLIRAAKQVGRDVIPGITGAWPLSPSFGLRTIEDHMDATLEDAVQGINRIAAMARTERERNTAAAFQMFFPVRTTSDRAILSNRSAAEVFDRAILGMRPGPQQDFAPYEKGAKEFHRSLMQQLERTSRDAYAVFLQQRSLSSYDQILNAAMDVAPDMKIEDGRFAMVDAPQSSLGKFMQTQMGDDPIANDLRLEMLRQVMVGSSWNRARDAVIGAAERRILGAGEVARYFSAAMQFSQAEMVDWIDAEINKRENTDSSQMVALWAILEQMSDVTGRSAKVRQKLLEQFGRTAESSPFWAGNETGEDVLRIREAGINKLSTRPEAPDIYPIMSKALEAADR
jgi:hypothetical protein